MRGAWPRRTWRSPAFRLTPRHGYRRTSGQISRELPGSDSTHQKHGQTVSEPFPLFLFPEMGGYDPKLVEVGIARGGAVTTVEVAYPAWRVLHEVNEFDFETLVSDTGGQITKHCPACAILLAGCSFGGIVAFAAAGRGLPGPFPRLA